MDIAEKAYYKDNSWNAGTVINRCLVSVTASWADGKTYYYHHVNSNNS